jgi:hypothetical protein
LAILKKIKNAKLKNKKSLEDLDDGEMFLDVLDDSKKCLQFNYRKTAV